MFNAKGGQTTAFCCFHRTQGAYVLNDAGTAGYKNSRQNNFRNVAHDPINPLEQLTFKGASAINSSCLQPAFSPAITGLSICSEVWRKRTGTDDSVISQDILVENRGVFHISPHISPLGGFICQSHRMVPASIPG